MLSNMKYVIYLLLGVISITILAPNVDFQKVKSLETSSITSTPEVKAEATKEPVKDAKKQAEAKKNTKPKDVVKENPKGCNQAKEWILPDGTCKDKGVEGSNSSSTSSKAKLSGSGSCEASIRRIFPASEHDRAIRVMLQESSGNPANHNYDPVTKDNSYGCFQVNLWGANARTRPPASELVVADKNVAYAYNLWKTTGWCSSGGWLNTSIKLGIC